MQQAGIYFLSIPLPEELIMRIREWRSTIQSDGLIKWVREEKLHITILFFGKIDNELLKEIEEKINSLVQTFKSFEAHIVEPEIKKLHNRKKNMLWLKLENNPEFDRLHEELRNTLSKYADFRKGAYNPHITLARHVNKSYRLNPDFKKFEHTMQVNTVELMESDRSEKEVKYVVKNISFLT